MVKENFTVELMRFLRSMYGVEILKELGEGDKSLQELASMGAYSTVYDALELGRKEPLKILEKYETSDGGVMYRLALDGIKINFRPEFSLEKIGK